MKVQLDRSFLTDPLKFIRLCWPDENIYDKQLEIIKSVVFNDETIAVAGNQLGKDYITALIAIWFFVSRTPCHVVTSSSGEVQLKSVLWGEMRKFISKSKIPLGIQVNEKVIKQINADGGVEDQSYILAVVTNVAENLQGHHLPRGPRGEPRTMVIFDEASGIEDEYYNASDTWAHRKLIIGNPLPCTNFFYRAVKDGDMLSADRTRYYRKIIKIKAEDSPSVQLGIGQVALGKKVTNEELLPGLINYDTYLKRRATWDKIRQCVGLDAEFYEGAEVLLFPPDWLNAAETYHNSLRGRTRIAESMGIDPAQGGDDTVWTVIDRLGIIEQISMKTPDTSIIPDKTIALIKKHNLQPDKVIFDRGGGGIDHACVLRRRGYNVDSVAFGASVSPEKRKRIQIIMKGEKREEVESRYVYKNRRAEMYYMLRMRIDPKNQIPPHNGNVYTHGYGFGIPPELIELRRQLAPIPLLYDPEGRLYLPKKDKINPDSKEITLKEMLGCSPDEADSTVLAVYALYAKPTKKLVGAF